MHSPGAPTVGTVSALIECTKAWKSLNKVLFDALNQNAHI